MNTIPMSIRFQKNFETFQVKNKNGETQIILSFKDDRKTNDFLKKLLKDFNIHQVVLSSGLLPEGSMDNYDVGRVDDGFYIRWPRPSEKLEITLGTQYKTYAMDKNKKALKRTVIQVDEQIIFSAIEETMKGKKLRPAEKRTIIDSVLKAIEKQK